MIEGIVLNPVEPTACNEELRAVHPLKLYVLFMRIYGAVEDQVVFIRSNIRKGRSPILVARRSERKCVLLRIQRGRISG